MSLTHIRITQAKPRATPYKIADSDALHLAVQPSGAKLWRMNYRYLGSQKTLHFGAWPAVSLSKARAFRDEARTKLASGVDPGRERRIARLAAKVAADNSFRTVAEKKYVKIDREDRAPATLSKIRWLLGIAYPLIGGLPIDGITAHEVLAVLRTVERGGRYESARRMRSVISRVLRYGIATARAERDVAADLRGALTTPKVTHLAAITEPRRAGALLRAIETFSGPKLTALALRLSPHLMVRPGELTKAEWADIDLPDRVWTIPAAKMKMRRTHQVPLSRQVIALLEELWSDGRHVAALPGRPSTRPAHVEEHGEWRTPATGLRSR